MEYLKVLSLHFLERTEEYGKILSIVSVQAEIQAEYPQNKSQERYHQIIFSANVIITSTLLQVKLE
jgi:hypothetical protein